MEAFCPATRLALETNHLLITHKSGQQVLQGLTIQCSFDANVATDHLDMAVVVMIVVVMAVVVVVMTVVVSVVLQA